MTTLTRVRGVVQAPFRCTPRFAGGKCWEIARLSGYLLMMDPSSDRCTRPSLLLRIRDPRDAEAWKCFVDVYTPLVYGHCRQRGLQPMDAEDVTQTVLLQVSQAIRKFEYDSARGRFRDWLGTVTRNEINRSLKKAARAVQGQGGSDTAQVLDSVPADTQDTEWTESFNAHIWRTALERSRRHFEERTWRAFEMSWNERRPAAEVARELNLDLPAVYRAKDRVLQRLRQEVLELAEDTVLFGTSSR